MTEQQWAEQYDKYNNLVRQVCYNYEKTEARLEELCQDVWERAFIKSHQFNGDADFGTWLYTIARTTSLNYIRKKKSRPPIEYYADIVEPFGTGLMESVELDDGKLLLAEDMVQEDEGENPESWYDAEIISSILGYDLDHDLWAILYCNIVLNMTVKEIAEIHHMNAQSVYNRIHKGKQEIKEIVEKISSKS